MKLIDGKFYEGDKVIPLEFGNKDQIKIMEEARRTMCDLSGDGLVVDPDIEEIMKVSVSIKCLCGYNVHFNEREIAGFDDAKEELKGDAASCRKCGKKYILDIFDGDLVVKLKQ